MADSKVEMVVVDGVRYRPEHAPKKKATAPKETEAKQAPAPRNKARSASDK